MSILLSHIEFSQQYPQIHQKQAQEFVDYCKVHNNIIAQSTIELAAHILFNKDLPTRQIPTITLRMGLGKSTLVNLYTSYMRTVDPLYGAMIAVERVNTIKDSTQLYKNCYGLYGFQKGDCVKNLEYYNPNMCRVCEEDNCRVQKNAEYVPFSPLLMITHSRLNLIMQDKQALTDIMYFYDKEYAHQYRRSDLFVDECPGFFTIDHLNEKLFLLFQNNLHNVYRRDCKQRRELIDYFKGYIKAIRQQLRGDYKGFFNIPTITESQENFSVFLKFKKKFMMNYYGAYYQVCLNVLNAIHQGGYIKNHVFTAPREHELLTGDHRTIILDGTAHINASYPQQCIIIDFPDKRVFSNVTWNIDQSHNLSKEYYHSHPDFVPKIKDFILKQLDKHQKILLVTFLDMEKIYRSYFTEKELERIYIDHFNNLKGKNQYRDATCMFYLGTLYKGDIYYLFYYKYCEKLEGRSVDLELVDFENRDMQHSPIDVSTKEIKSDLKSLISYDQADMTMQDAFRCEPRGNEQSFTEYFIYCTNDELTEKIEQFFPGANIINRKIIQAQSEQITNIIQELENIHNTKGTVRKKDLAAKLGISGRMLRKYLANQYIINEITRLNITISAQTISAN